MSTNPNIILPYGTELAQPLQRLGATILDLVMIYGFALIVVPLIVIITQILIPNYEFGVFFLVALIYGSLIFPFVINLYFLEKYGQSIGKRILKLKIVHQEGASLSSDRLIFLRHIVPTIIFNVPVIGIFFFFMDSLLVFSSERQCIHDRLAKTIVVCTKSTK